MQYFEQNPEIKQFQALAAQNAGAEAKEYLKTTFDMEAVAAQQAMLIEAFRVSGVNVKDHHGARPIVELSKQLDGLKAKQQDALDQIKASVKATLTTNPVSEAQRSGATIELLIEGTTQKIAADILAQNKEKLVSAKQGAALDLLGGMFTVIDDRIKGQQIRNTILRRECNGHTNLIDSTAVDLTHVATMHRNGNGKAAT